jgi:hypothetical protein
MYPIDKSIILSISLYGSILVFTDALRHIGEDNKPKMIRYMNYLLLISSGIMVVEMNIKCLKLLSI